MIEQSAEVLQRTSCPICGEISGKSLLSLPYSDARIFRYLSSHYAGRWQPERLNGHFYTVVLCRTCGLIYQKTIPNGPLLKDIYDTWIPGEAKDRLRKRYTLEDYVYLASQVHWLILNAGMRPSELKVLDFGMGWAEWTNMARAYGCNAFGAELSEERIAHAKAIGIPIVDWESIPGSGFDFINTEQVFEHLIDPVGVLKHLVSGLGRGGLIKISVPDGSRVRSLISGLDRIDKFKQGILMPVHPLEHINCFRHQSLLRLARAAGLEPARPSLLKMYDAFSGWFSLRRAAKNLLRPIYRHIFPKSTFVYFTVSRHFEKDIDDKIERSK